MQSSTPHLVQDVLLALLLGVLTLCVFAQVHAFEFVALDDPDIVSANPAILSGLSWNGLKWAFTHGHYGIWMPLTSISHMTDATLFGLKPSGHHVSSLLLHLCNVILVYLALRMLTGEPLKAAFVAALFAIHPMRAEAVAWVSSRKEILAGTFWFLSLIAYGWYARRPSVPRYLFVFAAFVLGLMAKPIIITLPFLLLLLDYWPLRRLASPVWPTLWPRLMEKLPLVIVTIPVVYVLVHTQAALGALASFTELPLGTRLAQAPVNCLVYLYHMVAPLRLACYYPHPFAAPPIWKTLAAAGLLAVVTMAVLLARQRPYLLVGWFWFLGTIMPVSGLLQVSTHTVADRYSYATLLGLNILATWGVADLVKASALTPVWRRRTLYALASGSVTILAGMAWWQTSFYRDSETLFRRDLEVTKRNHYAQDVLGGIAYDRGDYQMAVDHYRRALDIRHDDYGYTYNLGAALLKTGAWTEAARLLGGVVNTMPNLADPHVDLAIALWNLEQTDEAMRQLVQAIGIEPDNVKAHMNYGICLLLQHRTKDAEDELVKASALDPENPTIRENLAKARQLLQQPGATPEPDSAQAVGSRCLREGLRHLQAGRYAEAQRTFEDGLRAVPEGESLLINLGIVLCMQGHKQEGKTCLERAAAAHPDSVAARVNLATALCNDGQYALAEPHLMEAVRLDPSDIEAHQVLGLAFARQGKTQQAAEQFQKVLELNPHHQDAQNELQTLVQKPAGLTPPAP